MELVNLFKYNRGLDITAVSPSVDEMEMFTILDNMRNFLYFDFDIFNLKIEEEINLNMVHLNLGLYSMKQKEA